FREKRRQSFSIRLRVFEYNKCPEAYGKLRFGLQASTIKSRWNRIQNSSLGMPQNAALLAASPMLPLSLLEKLPPEVLSFWLITPNLQPRDRPLPYSILSE